jgi:hypothetical protein
MTHKNKNALLSCDGYSGGPLLTFSNATETLLGITSFGSRFCNIKKPIAYTRIRHYISWIKEAISQKKESSISAIPAACLPQEESNPRCDVVERYALKGEIIARFVLRTSRIMTDAIYIISQQLSKPVLIYKAGSSHLIATVKGKAIFFFIDVHLYVINTRL